MCFVDYLGFKAVSGIVFRGLGFRDLGSRGVGRCLEVWGVGL